jgi:hypothetical protein
MIIFIAANMIDFIFQVDTVVIEMIDPPSQYFKYARHSLRFATFDCPQDRRCTARPKCCTCNPIYFSTIKYPSPFIAHTINTPLHLLHIQ